MIHRGGTFAPESSAWVTPKDESGKLDKPNYPFFRQAEKWELGNDSPRDQRRIRETRSPPLALGGSKMFVSKV